MAKRILRELKLDKIAAVDFPCQEGAVMTIMKRAEKGAKLDVEKIAKDLYGVMSSSGNPPGPRSFADLFAATEACRRQSEVSQELWPYFDALTDSIRSIVADASTDEAGKISAIRQSIDQFTEAVTAAVPDAEAEIEKLFTDPASSGVFLAGNSAGDHVSKGDSEMSDDTKKVADLEKAVADLTKRAEKAEADLAKATTDLTAEKAKVADLAKAADIAKNDEVLKVGETEVRKSAVGEASFAFMKAQQAEIQKARDEAELATLTKRAETEIGHLPGEAIAKAKVLKAIGGMGEEDRKALDTMLKAGEAAIAKGFTTFGVKPGAPNSDDPIAKLDGLAKAKASKDSISYAKAYDEVLKTEEGQALYAASQKAA